MSDELLERHGGDADLLAAIGDELDAVEAALGRLETPLAGRCEVCQGPIDSVALLAHPLSARCASHAA